MAAGRKLAAAAVALVAIVLLLAAAADAQKCGVTWGTVSKCMSYCDSGNKAQDDCCRPLRGADLNCVCENYWERLQSTPKTRDCANKLKNDCSISHSC